MAEISLGGGQAFFDGSNCVKACRNVMCFVTATSLTLEDFLRDNPGKTEADFMALKAVSDEIYLEQARLETAQGNKTFSMTGRLSPNALKRGGCRGRK